MYLGVTVYCLRPGTALNGLTALDVTSFVSKAGNLPNLKIYPDAAHFIRIRWNTSLTSWTHDQGYRRHQLAAGEPDR